MLGSGMRKLLDPAMRHAETVILLPFPRDDELFVRRAHSFLEELDGDLVSAPERLEALLRREYPGAVVQPRDGLAALDGSNEAWYVFRDGTATVRTAGRATMEPP